MSLEHKRRAPQGPRINDRIRASEVRLVDQAGEFVGVMTLSEALAKASSAGLDLVEVAPDARPPVCKILDYGKLRFEERKKKSLMKRKQKSLETKELQFRLKIGDHDYDVKLRHAVRFLTQGHRVRVVLRFKGREMSYQDIGVALLNRIISDLAELSKPESPPRTEGRRMLVVMVPIAKKLEDAKADKSEESKDALSDLDVIEPQLDAKEGASE